MPSPIAHSITGYALSRLLPLRDQRIQWRDNRHIKLLLAVFVANVADLDFIGQFLNLTSHRGFTHSLTFMVCFSLMASLAAWAFWRPVAKQLFLFTLVIYGSHLLLDFITIGGPGMKLLWPLSDGFYGAATRIFPAVRHDQGLIYGGHLKFISFELLYSSLTLTLLSIWEKFSRYRRLNSIVRKTLRQPN